MTAVVLLAVLTGAGLLGIVSGLRHPNPPLDSVWAAWQRPAGSGRPVRSHRPPLDRYAAAMALHLSDARWADDPRGVALRRAFAVTGTDPVAFASRLVVIAGVGGLGPIGLWLGLEVLGTPVPLAPMVVVAVVTVPSAVALQFAALFRRASERRRHVRVVLGSFVDLVVLSLAGGEGIDGALHSASRVTPDWAARRIASALLTARDAGTGPWDALAALGDELGVQEFVELSTTVQLAGTEGSRIRQTLSARGASLRRHEQAEAESAANAMTERLFLPGALLLSGFLLFIGYPAVHRILGGF